MTENYTAPSQLFQPRADLVRTPRPSLRAESNVKVNAAMGTLIRAAQLRPEHKDFNHETMTISMLDMHNSYLHYLKQLYPGTTPPGTILEIRDETLKAVWQTDRFDPSDKKWKWRIFVKSLIEIDGQPYRSAQRPVGATRRSPIIGQNIQEQSPALNARHDPAQNNPAREYEPAPLNGQRLQQREQILRQRLKDLYTEVDNHIGSKILNQNKSDRPQTPDALSSRKRNTFSFDGSENPTENKRIKLEEDEEIPESDRCIICMEKRKTHAFLHFGLSSNDMTSHFVACEDCAKTCRWADQGCPMCRQPCINIVRILK